MVCIRSDNKGTAIIEKIFLLKNVVRLFVFCIVQANFFRNNPLPHAPPPL